MKSSECKPILNILQEIFICKYRIFKYLKLVSGVIKGSLT